MDGHFDYYIINAINMQTKIDGATTSGKSKKCKDTARDEVKNIIAETS